MRTRWECKDIQDAIVIECARKWQEWSRSHSATCPDCGQFFCIAYRKRLDADPRRVPGVTEQLCDLFPGCPVNVVYAKVQRLVERDLLEYGSSMRYAWPTEKGLALLQKVKGE